MRRAVIGGLIALAVGLGATAVGVLAWAVDVHAHRGRVERNVVLSGHRIGGMNLAQLRVAIDRAGRELAVVPVEVKAPEGGFSTDTASLGLRLDPDPTVKAALRVGRHGPAYSRFSGWLTSFMHPATAPARVAIDRAAAFRVVADLDPGPRTAPIEPTIGVKLGHLVAVDGKPGHGIDARDVIHRLPGAVAAGRPLVVRVGRGEVRPRWTITDAAKVARDGEALVTHPLPVAAGTATATVTVTALRSWLTARPRDDGLHLAVDPAKSLAQLATLLPKAGDPAVETSFTVTGDVPQVVPGKPGTGCCALDAADIIQRALQRGPGSTPVQLPLKRVDPLLTAEAAATLGINEKVSTFTTKHPCCAPRVQNIHRIADLLRGVVIKPGETFSVNSFVGPRTPEKGFVVDHVIEDGKFAESVGGGISQFGTTAFNAAFFAGLEIPEYMAHTIYIDRYPYGREATLSYPHPDLKIKNVSPYGVLVWPTYTGTTLTVTFYSTHWADVEQSGQTTAPRGDCTAVRTQRTRKFTDGSTKIDYFTALYQPAEGVVCK